MPDLNAEQFLVESPSAAAEDEENAVTIVTSFVPKIDHKDKYIEYVFDEWNN